MLFIFYFTKITGNDEIQIDTCTKDDCFEINPQYADDVTWVSIERNRLDLIKLVIPDKLVGRNLEKNQD